MIEKQRKAGELKRPEKASADRSTEAVAKALSVDKEALDVGQELRDCENQVQLKFTQQKLARMQRVADEKGALSKGKQLTHVPKYIQGEADNQHAWIAERKKLKEAAKGTTSGKTEPEKPDPGSSGASGSAEGPSSTLLVDCATCEKQFTWESLSINDGVCAECLAGEQALDLAAEAGGDLTVECSQCQEVLPWSLLQLGDGACPKCFQEEGELRESRGGEGEIGESRGYASPKHASSAVLDVVDGPPSPGEVAFPEQANDHQIGDVAVVQANPLTGGGWRSRRRIDQGNDKAGHT